MDYILTEDGSYTLLNAEIGECYHSTRGAIMEAEHVFINAGLKFVNKKQIQILEVGFGTGLNALLSLFYAEQHQLEIYYETIEAFPLEVESYSNLNYEELLNMNSNYLEKLHKANIGSIETISPYFTLKKIRLLLQDYLSQNSFDVIYFDAFSANVQPELWTKEIFTRLHSYLNVGGVLVTYASKGIVKQALRDSGFRVRRLPGAGGKRHMLRGEK